MSKAVNNRINDLMTVLQTTEDHSVTQLQEIALELDTWKTKVCVGVGVRGGEVGEWKGVRERAVCFIF